MEWTLAKAEWRDVAPDGSAAFRAMRAPYPAPPEGTWRDESGRWGRWTEDAGLESTAPARRRVFGPADAWLESGQLHWADGTSTECPGRDDLWAWRPDGLAAVVHTWESGPLVDGVARWHIAGLTLASPLGCVEFPEGTTSAALSGEQVWSVADGRLWTGLDDRRSPVDLAGIELLEVRNGRGRVYASGRAGEASVVLARIGAEWIELHRGADWRRFWSMNGCFYEPSTRRSHCFDAGGRELLAAEVPLATLLGDGWLHDRAGHAVHRPVDGARVALPGPAPDPEDVDRGRLILLPAGGLRYFAPNGRVHDVELPGGP